MTLQRTVKSPAKAGLGRIGSESPRDKEEHTRVRVDLWKRCWSSWGQLWSVICPDETSRHMSRAGTLEPSVSISRDKLELYTL